MTDTTIARNLTNIPDESFATIIAALAPRVNGWDGLAREEREAWIEEVVHYDFEGSGGDFEIAAQYSATGNPATLAGLGDLDGINDDGE